MSYQKSIGPSCEYEISRNKNQGIQLSTLFIFLIKMVILLLIYMNFLSGDCRAFLLRYLEILAHGLDVNTYCQHGDVIEKHCMSNYLDIGCGNQRPSVIPLRTLLQ